MSRKPVAQRIVDRLAGEHGERMLSLVIEFMLEQPVSTYVHVDDLIRLVSLASTGPNASRQIEQHIRPGWERHLARCEASGDTLGAALPQDVQSRIPRLILDTRPPKSAWAKDAVDPKLIREFFAPVLQGFLLGFARKLPIPGRTGSAPAEERSRTGFGLRNRIKESASKRAEKFVEAGKNVLGGLSAEVERQIQTAARDFSQSAERDVRRALVDRVRSDEGRALLTEIVEQAVSHVLETPISAMNEDVDALPWDDLWALVPPTVEHNRDRGPVVEAIEEELRALVEVEGERPVRELLDESGLLDDTVAAILEHSRAPATAFFASDSFRALVDDLVK